MDHVESAPVVGFDTSRDEFLGQFNGWDTPQVIAEGKAHDSVAHGWFPIAANRVRLELQPDETASLVFMLGYIEVAKDQKWEDPNDPAKVAASRRVPRPLASSRESWDLRLAGHPPERTRQAGALLRR